MTQHTPTPWRAVLPGFNKHIWSRFIVDKDGHLIARINYANPVQSETEAIANADFIALAVNNHAGLVASLTAVSAALADHITREAKAKDVTPENLCPCATTDLKAALILLHTIRMVG